MPKNVMQGLLRIHEQKGSMQVASDKRTIPDELKAARYTAEDFVGVGGRKAICTYVKVLFVQLGLNYWQCLGFERFKEQ